MKKLLLWLSIPALNTLYQIFIKLSANNNNGTEVDMNWFINSTQQSWFIAAILSELVCFILWMKILSTVELSKAFPLSGASYILIVLSSWVIFHEPVMFLQIVGSGLIIAGVWMIGSGENKKSIIMGVPNETTI